MVEFLVDNDPWKKAANALCDAMRWVNQFLTFLISMISAHVSALGQMDASVSYISDKSEVLKLVVVGKKNSEEVEEEYLLALSSNSSRISYSRLLYSHWSSTPTGVMQRMVPFPLSMQDTSWHSRIRGYENSHHHHHHRRHQNSASSCSVSIA